MIAISRNGLIADITSGVSDVLGFDALELIGKEFCELINSTSDDSKDVSRFFSYACVHREYINLKAKDGSTMTLIFMFRPRLGGVSGVVASDVDGDFDGILNKIKWGK
jgi:hypothetical protein